MAQEGVEIDDVGRGGAGRGGEQEFAGEYDEGTEDERVLDEEERKKRERNDRRNERRRRARKLKREAREAMRNAVAQGNVNLVGEDDALAIEGLFNLANSTGQRARNGGARRDSSISPRKKTKKNRMGEDETTRRRAVAVNATATAAAATSDMKTQKKKKRKRAKPTMDANNIPKLPGGAEIDLQLLKKTVADKGGYHHICEVRAYISRTTHTSILKRRSDMA